MAKTDKKLISSMTLDEPLREWNVYKYEDTYICEEILYVRDKPSKSTLSCKFSEIYEFFNELDTRYSMTMFNSIKL